jgi:hypothetical protein
MRTQLAVLAVLFVLQVGCGAMGRGPGPDDDDDAGGDGDADADADADADVDADADAGVDWDETSPQDCIDDLDNDEDGLLDCTDLGCVGLVECCEQASDSLFDETFDDTLNLGKWKPFGDGAVVVQDGALYPSGDDRHESGVVTNDSFPVTGVLELQISVTVPSCEGACDELVGVALTSRNDYAEASTVDPVAGLVVDKSTGQAVALLVINGGVEQSAPITDGVVSVTIQVQPDRRLRVTDDLGGLWFESEGTVDRSLTDAYVAIFGRSGATAGVGEVKLRAGACTLPSSVHRPGPAAILPAGVAPFAVSAVRSGSLARVPAAADLEMLFTGVTSGATSIGHATSSDVGRSWITSPGETAILTDDEMPAGYGSPDDPGLLIRASGEHVAVVSAASVGDASQRSLVFATSPDGLAWTVRPDPPLAPPEGCRSLRHPELVEAVLDELVLFATCEDDDGLTSIRRAESPDLASWFFDALPILASDGIDPLEIDGVAAPTVLVGGGVWELWYEARSGVRRVLRYAVSSDGASWERWDGTVLDPGASGAWDDLQVGEPAAVMAPAGGELLLYYTGLGPTGQAIGLVTRDLPFFSPEL